MEQKRFDRLMRKLAILTIENPELEYMSLEEMLQAITLLSAIHRDAVKEAAEMDANLEAIAEYTKTADPEFYGYAEES